MKEINTVGQIMLVLFICVLSAGCDDDYRDGYRVGISAGRQDAEKSKSQRVIILSQEDADKLNKMAEVSSVRIYDEAEGGKDCNYTLGKQSDGTTIYLKVNSPHPNLDVSVVRILPKSDKPGQSCDYHKTIWGWSKACAPQVYIGNWGSEP